MTHGRIHTLFLTLTLTLAGIGGLPAPALAVVTAVDDVELNEPGNGDITVGYDNSFGSPDFAFGQLFIDGGSQQSYDEMVIGNRELAIGEVYVSGDGTSLTLTDSGFTSGQALVVGEEGTGTLSVSAGALLNISNPLSGTLEIGEEVTGFGRVTVTGRSSTNFPTRMIVAENLIVGGEGIGELTIADGALVNHTETDSSTLTIGEVATGHGVITVKGQSTYWQAPELINIGVVGSGELHVYDGATFDADNDLLDTNQTSTIGTRGYVSLKSGGRFFVESATIAGRLGGDGFVKGPITIATTGKVSSGPGQKLQFAGNVANAGLIDVTGTPESRSEIEFLGALTNVAAAAPTLDGRIAVADGVLRLGQTLTNDGTLASTGGDTDFHGNITNGAMGLIAVAGESHATFYDTVDNTVGTISVGTGSTALFLSDLTLGPLSTLAITVDESAVEPGFDTPVQVLGSTFLGAPITLELADGFVPSEGDQIPLLEASGGFAIDTLSTQDFEPLPSGLEWEVLPTNEGLIAQVVASFPAVPGDFNGDTIVNAADYTVGRDLIGLQGDSPADADGSGTVDAADLAFWQREFGSVSPAVAAQGTVSVPEPVASILGLIGLSMVAVRQRR